ncbi:MAG: glycogen debranching N-terminal domain-containing protein [Chloroflexota bacterium]
MVGVEPTTTESAIMPVEHTHFAVSDRSGDMLPGLCHGFFVADTRVLSQLVVRLDGERLEPLATGGDDHHGAGTLYLASPRLPDVLAPREQPHRRRNDPQREPRGGQARVTPEGRRYVGTWRVSPAATWLDLPAGLRRGARNVPRPARCRPQIR